MTPGLKSQLQSKVIIIKNYYCYYKLLLLLIIIKFLLDI